MIVCVLKVYPERHIHHTSCITVASLLQASVTSATACNMASQIMTNCNTNIAYVIYGGDTWGFDFRNVQMMMNLKK